MMNTTTVREEPRIIQFGRYKQERDYPVETHKGEFLNSFARVYKIDPNEVIRLDSNMHAQGFLAAAAAWAIDEGLLEHFDTVSDTQSEVYYFKLTAKGKQTILK